MLVLMYASTMNAQTFSFLYILTSIYFPYFNLRHGLRSQVVLTNILFHLLQFVVVQCEELRFWFGCVPERTQTNPPNTHETFRTVAEHIQELHNTRHPADCIEGMHFAPLKVSKPVFPFSMFSKLCVS